MVMRPGQPILAPASSSFVYGSLFVALMINLLPWRGLWVPDILALTLFFWALHQPKKVGMGVAFFFGLLMDVYYTMLLGQYALTYTVLAFFAILMHRRLTWFSLFGQAMQMMPILLLVKLMPVAMRGLISEWAMNWQLLVSVGLEVLLWPILSVILFAPQRHAPESDEALI